MITRVIISVIAIGTFAAGCGNDSDPQHENRLPTAQLTAGPVEGDTTNYQVRLFWTGEDPDGYVAGYQYALDPPAEFSEEEIAAGALGIEETFLPGADGAPDTTRVSKLVGAQPFSFVWIHTQDFSEMFRFSASRAESAGVESSRHPTGRFLGMHAVYVRAIDDNGARSIPDHVAFTAETVAPTSRVDRPVPPNSYGYIVTSPTFRLQWSGSDPDRGSGGKPLRFEYAAVEVPDVICLTFDCRSIYLWALRNGTWLPLPADSTEIHFTAEWTDVVLGVRAVDEAGAVEPFLDFGRNAILVHTTPNAGVPQVTLASDLGSFSFSGLDAPKEIEAIANLPMTFAVYATAEEYGEEIAGWRWGVDLADVESDEGWSAWTTDSILPPISFSQGQVHTLFVEARDAGGGLTRALLIFDVTDAPMDRALLWVDDSRDKVVPNDTQLDAFWNSLIQDSGRFDMASDVFKYEAHGEDDVYNAYPIPPTLAQLGRYRLIIWECFGDGYNGVTGLLSATSFHPRLGLYLRAGGQLWVDGALTVPAMLASSNGVNADFVYPKNVASQLNSFAFRFMKLASEQIRNAKGVPPDDNMIGVKPFPGRTAIYPQMDQDPAKISPYKGSISHGDVVVDPIYAQDRGFAGVIDSLYVYQARRTGSTYNNKLNAIRWHDPDPAREHGRTQWFGFQMYYMKKDQAQETFNRAVDWFREEVRP
jgi:hypothetical protein